MTAQMLTMVKGYCDIGTYEENALQLLCLAPLLEQRWHQGKNVVYSRGSAHLMNLGTKLPKVSFSSQETLFLDPRAY